MGREGSPFPPTPPSFPTPSPHLFCCIELEWIFLGSLISLHKLFKAIKQALVFRHSCGPCAFSQCIAFGPLGGLFGTFGGRENVKRLFVCRLPVEAGLCGAVRVDGVRTMVYCGIHTYPAPHPSPQKRDVLVYVCMYLPPHTPTTQTHTQTLLQGS